MAALYGFKGVEDKSHIKCIDMDGKYLGELPSKYFKNEELCVIGVGSNTYNMSGELKKVFVDEKSFKEFSEKIK